MIFLDANVVLRFLLIDDPLLSPKAKDIFEKIDGGEKVFIPSVIIAELVYVLLKVYKFPRVEISQKLLQVILKENILTENKTIYKGVFKIFVSKNIDFEDAYMVSLMGKKKVSELYSFDKDFDKFTDIKRLTG
ncbi:PIN domain-containing protein [Candidatus Daviesbacteria bacterium]|nr:PIN domain-containing protein [Candidatus Daviesbacteria bacterium]